MCFLPPSNPRLSNPRVVPPRCHLPLWLSPAHVLSQSCQTENYLTSQRRSSRSNEGELAQEPLQAASTHNINLLFPQHLSVPLEMATPPRLRCQAGTDRSPPVWLSSRVRPPYQLLASRSPSGKFQDSFMHFRGIQRPSFPVETTHEWRSNAVFASTACTMHSRSKQVVLYSSFCILACSLAVGFINHPHPFFSTSWLCFASPQIRNSGDISRQRWMKG